MPHPRSVAILLVLALSAVVCGSEGRANATLVIRDVSVIEPGGTSPPARFDVVIGDGLILALEPAAGVATAPLLLDGTGMFLIPGLIDTHVHLTVPWYPALLDRRLRDALLDGVTSIREMGGHLPAIEPAIAAGRDARQPVPRIYPSALLASDDWIAGQHFPRSFGAGLHAWLRAVPGTADPDALVADAVRASVTGIKITSGIDMAMVRRISDRAHAAGLMVWTHAAIHPGRPRDAVLAGVDVVSHSPLLAWETPDTAWPGELDTVSWLNSCAEIARTPAPVDALFAIMRQRGTLLEPTLFNYHHAAQPGRDTARIEACSNWLAARARAAGVPMIAGTDYFISLGGRATVHDELQRLVQAAGLTPRQALATATCNAARALGRGGRVGGIAAGMDADLVLLAADPTADIANTRSVVGVIKQGQWFPRRAATHSVQD